MWGFGRVAEQNYRNRHFISTFGFARFRSVYMVTKSFYASDMKKEREKQQYIEDLKNYKKTHPDEDFSDVMEKKKKRYPEHVNR